MQAFTVRQYIGYCSTSTGSGWRNFASVYVWKQYHDLGLDYRAYAGIAVSGEYEAWGFIGGGDRQRFMYSVPEPSVKRCTQGVGYISRTGGLSATGLTSLVC